MRIGVFGASFNPPTHGHADVIEQARLHFDEIILVPSLLHPFDKNMLDLSHRLELLQRFIEPWKKETLNGQVKIFNVESIIYAAEPHRDKIYTVDVLFAVDHFYASLYQDYTIRFIIGPDNADPAVWKQFYQYHIIEAKWGVFIAQENYLIRSTHVRRLLAASDHQAINIAEKLEKMVSQPVAHYILQEGLYSDGK